MIYTVKEGDTLRKVAQRLTLDEAYWEAIAHYNGIESLASRPAGSTLSIPDEWLKPEWQKTEPTNWLLIGGAAIMALLIFSGRKS